MKDKIKITQTKSVIGQSQKKKDTIIALGLNKINRTAVHSPTLAILGMVKKVSHLIHVEKITK